MDDVNHTKSRTAQSAENRHGGNSPEDEFEVEVVTYAGGVVGFAHGHGQDGVGNHPDYDHIGAHGAVVVFLLLGFADAFLGDFEPVTEVSQGFVVAGVDIELFRRHFQFDRISFPGDSGAQVHFYDVVAFCAPGDIVRVTEGVNLEGADI